MTTINYELKQDEKVNLSILNLKGEEVIKLIDQFQSAGEYQYIWDGKDRTEKEVNSGIYIVVLKCGDFKQSIKLSLIR